MEVDQELDQELRRVQVGLEHRLQSHAQASHPQRLPAPTLSMPVCIGASLKVGGMGVWQVKVCMLRCVDTDVCV